MKWIVSVEFSRPKAYHQFFSLLNRGLIKDTRMTNHSDLYKLIEIETTTTPEEDKIKKLGSGGNDIIIEMK